MRRNARSMIFIALIVAITALSLAFKTIDIGNFERGSQDTPLGLSLGLDLQGGSHLVYQAQFEEGTSDADKASQMEGLRRIIERRVNDSGLGEPIIQILGDDRLLIQLPGVDDPERAKALIGQTATLEFKHRRFDVPAALSNITSADIVAITADRLTAEGGLESDPPPPEPEPTPEAEATPAPEGQATPAPEATPEAQPTPEPAPGPIVLVLEFTDEGVAKLQPVLDRLDQSLASLGTGHLALSRPSRLEISLDAAQMFRFEVTSFSIQRIGESNRFAVVPFPQPDSGTPVATVEEARALLGDGPTASFTEIQGQFDESIGLTGDDLSRAFPSQHAHSGVPIVNLEFNEQGTRIFGEITRQIAGSSQDAIAIFLDNQELIAPVVTTPIETGTAIIQGNFTIERARDIALLLESGRLPVDIGDPVQERNVDAILGEDSLRKSVVAGLVGLGIVVLFMVLYYRVPGVMAALALLVYTAILLSISKLLPVTLTLSGVAAAILSIGLAVDGNILIFERMKDELRAGRTLMSALNIGFNRAWPAIRDGNVTTLITAAILFWFSNQLGATIVLGFAVTLAIGTVLSMFTAIFVSRTFMRVAAASRLSRNLGLFIPPGEIT
ncbi:MAG: protein translocase subunit SecD, partial [Chloroflexi bacterium]|nr:protein translocase subunit SecD [Chloroflexota bacterium]